MPYLNLSFAEVSSQVVRQVGPLHVQWNFRFLNDLNYLGLTVMLMINIYIFFNWQNLRPEIPRCCPSSLASIMRKCWDANPERRPEMHEVVSLLEAIDTSKGGGMIPEDQVNGCFCFSAGRGPWSSFIFLYVLVRLELCFSKVSD